MFEGAYPPGVTGKMIDDAFGTGIEKECCGTCVEFDGDYCMKFWNNMDRDYCVPCRDRKDPGDWCEDYEEMEDWV